MFPEMRRSVGSFGKKTGDRVMCGSVVGSLKPFGRFHSRVAVAVRGEKGNICVEIECVCHDVPLLAGYSSISWFPVVWCGLRRSYNTPIGSPYFTNHGIKQVS